MAKMVAKSAKICYNIAKMAILDSIDQELLQLLEQDARQKSEALAKQLGVSPTTVRRRIRDLIQSGVLRIVALVDPVEAGFPLISIIAFDVANENLESALQILTSRPEIKWLSTTTGRFDVLALARFRSTDELSNFVHKELADIEGLKDSETFVCLQVGKGRYMQV